MVAAINHITTLNDNTLVVLAEGTAASLTCGATWRVSQYRAVRDVDATLTFTVPASMYCSESTSASSSLASRLRYGISNAAAIRQTRNPSLEVAPTTSVHGGQKRSIKPVCELPKKSKEVKGVLPSEAERPIVGVGLLWFWEVGG